MSQPSAARAASMTASRQRRVAVDDARDLGVAALERADVDELLDQLGRLGADDVAAEQLAVLLVADDLHQAGAVAVDGAGADGAVLDLADDDVVAGLLAPAASVRPKRRDVRRAERRARDVDVVERVRLAARRSSSTAMMPSSEALCASAGPGTRSPIAQSLRADVRSAPSTSIRPCSSSLTPASSSPRPSTSGPRPAAITSQSASPCSSP